jgi:Putative peptidoglycan binding domain
MPPSLLRAVLATFAAITVMVGVNIAFLQPSPLTLARTQPLAHALVSQQPLTLVPLTLAQASVPAAHYLDGARRFARLMPDQARVAGAGDTLPEAPDAEGDKQTITAVQRELVSRGYGPLTPDGVPGLVTRAAIMAYEFDHRLPLKGEATASLLARIVLGSSANETVDAAAGRVRSPEAEIVLRTVQQSLAGLGYQVGKIDGHTSDDIARAIREFEVDEGMKQSGRVSAELFTRLAKAVAAKKGVQASE